MNHWSDSNVDLEMALNKANSGFFLWWPLKLSVIWGWCHPPFDLSTSKPDADQHFCKILKLKWVWNLNAAHLFKENISDTKFRYATLVLLQVRRFVGVAFLMATGCLLCSNGKFKIFLLSFLLLYFFTSQMLPAYSGCIRGESQRDVQPLNPQLFKWGFECQTSQISVDKKA